MEMGRKLESPLTPCLPTIWGIVSGLAWAKPAYQIHHFIIIAQSLTYPPIHEAETKSLISIPNFYLDPDQLVIKLASPLIRQHHVPGAELWA
jgi:hypothetical protein